MDMPPYFRSLGIYLPFQLAVGVQQHKSILPCAKPYPSVARLGHTKRVVATFTVKHDWFKPVLQTVQPGYKHRSAVGNRPNLVAVVREHL